MHIILNVYQNLVDKSMKNAAEELTHTHISFFLFFFLQIDDLLYIVNVKKYLRSLQRNFFKNDFTTILNDLDLKFIKITYSFLCWSWILSFKIELKVLSYTSNLKCDFKTGIS